MGLFLYARPDKASPTYDLPVSSVCAQKLY